MKFTKYSHPFKKLKRCAALEVFLIFKVYSVSIVGRAI
jgi:hypothetical protein